MIEAATFLSPMSCGRLDQTRRFMAESNSSGISYNISASCNHMEAVDLDILYLAEKYGDHAPKAIGTLKTDTGLVKIETYLFYGAVGLLTLMADQPLWLKIMRRIDPDIPEQDVWTMLEVDRHTVYKEDLRPIATGDFIAPQNGGYVYFSVDTHAEVTFEAEADHLAAVVFVFAAERAITKYRVDEKFGRFAQLA